MGAKNMIRTLMAVAASVGVLGSSGYVRGDSIEVRFTGFTIGETYPNATLPRTIVSDGVEIELTKYNNSSGASGRILNASTTGTDPALFLAANSRAEIGLPDVANGGFFFFRNYGGTNYLEINGELMNFTHSALSGSTFGSVGGVEVHSSPYSNGWRSVKVDGLAHSLAFIGQELAIDGISLGLGIPGDLNRDGSVDAADYVMWRKADNSQWSMSNFRKHFGVSTRSGSAATVPEPTSCLLWAMVAVYLTKARRVNLPGQISSN
jgi:hypothetical protein